MKASSQTNYGAVCINDGDANDVAATAEQEQPVLHEPIENYYHDNSNSSDNKRYRVLTSILWLVVVFSIIAVVKELPVPSSNALRGGIQMEMLQAAQADASSEGSITDPAADQPQPDYNGEGRYNWQKCKDSNDPNCWKNEGERVGGYWKNFGQRMKMYWMGFRQKMHDLFAGKDVHADDADADAHATTTTATVATEQVETVKKVDAGDADAKPVTTVTASEKEKTGKKKSKNKVIAAAPAVEDEATEADPVSS